MKKRTTSLATATILALAIATAATAQPEEPASQQMPYSAYAEKQQPAGDGPCNPKDEYYKDRDRGWYHNEKCVEPEKEPQKKQADAKPQAPQQQPIDWQHVTDPKYLESLNAEQFRKLLTMVKEEAVYHPTPDKVYVYMQLQDHARRKSIEFAYVWRDVLLQNPRLDMTVETPASNYGAFAQSRAQGKYEEKIMVEIRENVALLLFVSGECPYCWDQTRAMDIFSAKYNVSYKTYSKDFCPAQFSKCEANPALFEHFQVQMTPSIVAVFRDQQDKPVFQPLGNGLIVADEIVKRLIFYYNYIKTGQHPTS